MDEFVIQMKRIEELQEEMKGVNEEYKAAVERASTSSPPLLLLSRH